jgi:hypothetical protein
VAAALVSKYLLVEHTLRRRKARSRLIGIRRVYASGVPQQRDWYNGMERQALEMANQVVALSEKDKLSLRELQVTKKVDIHVLFPPLRGDVEKLWRDCKIRTSRVIYTCFQTRLLKYCEMAHDDDVS